MKNLSTFCLVISALVSAPAFAQSFSSDFESCDLDQVAQKWDGAEAESPERIAVLPTRNRNGLCILALELRPDDGAGGRSQRNRVEIKKDLPPLAGKEPIFKFSMLIPRIYPDTPSCDMIVAQWKQAGLESPTITLNLAKRGQEAGMRLTAGVKGRNVGPVATFPIDLDSWNDFEVHVRWARNRNGEVSITYNGVQKGRKAGANFIGGPYQFRLGQYAGTCRVSAPSVIMIDDVSGEVRS